jgi:hypothetical protein
MPRICKVRLVKKVCPWVDGAKYNIGIDESLSFEYPYFSTVCFSLDTPLGHQEEDDNMVTGMVDDVALIISACAARSGEIVLFCS